MHCEDPGCLKACPSPGAIVQYSNGIVDFHEESCIGCGYCVTGCPFDIPRISKKDHKAYKCTLCSDRVAVGLEPACIKSCPTGALVFGTKEDMKEHAAGRIEDLKSRGFENAGLYDPQGGRWHPRHVTCSITPINPGCTAISRRTRRSARWSAPGRVSRNLSRSPPWRSPRSPDSSITSESAPDETDEKDEAKAAELAKELAAKAAPGKAHTTGCDAGEDAMNDTAPPDTSDPVHRATIVRYTATQRINHWLVAGAFVGAALSGLALFHPALFWFTNLFGGGPWTRILHPLIGLFMLAAFAFYGGGMARENLMEPRDWAWLRKIMDVVSNREERLPEVGRNNAGQKMVFYSAVLCLGGLLLTGIVIWRAYFSQYFPITVIRWGALLHALCAFVLISTIIVHIYAAIWIKGSVRAMIRGTVTPGWAWKHHRAWFSRDNDACREFSTPLRLKRSRSEPSRVSGFPIPPESFPTALHACAN